MRSQLKDLSALRSALRSTTPAPVDPAAAACSWCLAELAGRLTELCGHGASAQLTLAFGLVIEAQRNREPAAWIIDAQSSFFPPDAADGGVDLEQLLVVRAESATIAARAADQLARSGAFGLVVLDVGAQRVPEAHLSRLLGLAQKHATAILFLTSSTVASLGSLISLRAEARRSRVPGQSDTFLCELVVVKDKRRAPGWTHQEICRGPTGLR